MRYRPREIVGLLRSPVGRLKVVHGALRYLWPAFGVIAAAYRRTLIRRVRVVAVVGSLGKTTTTRAVTAALGEPEWRRMTLNSYAMLALAVLRIRPWQRCAILEVGIRAPGDMARYARMVRPDVVVVTSIASEHHQSLGSLENTRTEKARMVEALRPGGRAILNGDDPHVVWMRGRTRERVVTVGLGDGNDIRATDVTLDWPNGMRFTLQVGHETRPVCTRLLGRHQVYSVLFGVAVARELGVPLDQALQRLERVEPARSRLQPLQLPNGAWLLRDEFKATDETFDAALDLLEQIPARRRIVVLGDADESPGPTGDMYRRIGGRLGAHATKLVLVGSKWVRRYRVGARKAGMPLEAIVDVKGDPTRVGEVLADLGPGDVVLVKCRNEQRLARISLALAGRTVGCNIPTCHVTMMPCDHCPMLERGWGSLTQVT